MDTNRFEFLLDRYLNGPASPEEAAELQRLLQGDAELRRQFADRFLLEVQLHKAYAGIVPALPLDSRPHRHWLPVGWSVAAAVLLVVGMSMFAWFTRSDPAPPATPVASINTVLAGEVRIDGVALQQLPEEKWFEVVGDAPAVIRLADGSQAEVAPASKAMIHGRRDGVREAVELERGGGQFKVKPGSAAFRVETAVGNVTVLGTEFSVKLDSRGKGESKRNKVRTTLTVAVTEGSVKVESLGKSYVVTAPEQRTFPEITRKEKEDD
jgi:ferric-dicitrate binding protein FerR (iron transport regulator)